MSAGEMRAWAALRSLREHGVHVVRQHAIGRYTVDFAIRKARIAIEIDGGVHDFLGRPEYDARRQAHLESKGWRFVRIRTELTRDPKAVIDAVRAVLPLPLRGGGRGWGEAPTSDNSPAATDVIPRDLQRRTRANRKLPPRRRDAPTAATAPSATNDSASPHPPTPSSREEGEV